MPQPHPRIQGGTEPYGQIRIPRIQGGAEPYGQIRIPDGLLFNVFRAPDGRFYTDHPRLKGPFRNYLRLRNAICHFFGCRNPQLRVTQGGPTIRPQGTRRASSPVVTEDSPSLPLPPPSELVAAVAESASALTLQDAHVSSSEELRTSSEESITSSPWTVPHSTIDSSSSFSPFRPEKFMAGAAEPASAQTLKDADVSSSEELLDATSSAELSTANPSSVLPDTADDSTPSASSVGPPILLCRPPNWYQDYYIRTDRNGYLQMYPDLGGPFGSLQEAEAAVNRHLDERRLPEICQMPSKGPHVEWLIKQCLHYPDGTPKRGPNAPSKNSKHHMRHLVKALLDQYNDYNNICKDLARELKDLVSFDWMYENNKTYYHFNFTTKTNKADDVNLFFAEVMCIKYDYAVTCCCMIKPKDDGCCYGCTSPKQKVIHPNNSRAYIGGHVSGDVPFGGDDDSSDEDEEAFVARLRFFFKGQ
ncbi:uncharacterized protein LOC120702511 isoform X1 [Panicum virgatum]|uniref:DUF3615 domain-containing protein n=1 Tax=Panicum virgatum TaxID=38727 RepID=A0A8T0TE34_PANVG|nr:uncharacterized protein LOC120702511 isoform X1 [Panicum virgatum]KAG2609230.1 hypothetical protein PVAP13_4KG018200 [Panicum virgatum]